MNIAAIDKFKADLLNADWNRVYQEDDVNVAYNTFLSTVKNINERNCPIKRVCINQKSSLGQALDKKLTLKCLSKKKNV